MDHSRKFEILSSKLHPVSGLLLTTIITLLLVAVSARNATLSGEIVLLVNNHRDSVAIVVQILSALLGFYTRLRNAYVREPCPDTRCTKHDRNDH